MSDNTATLKPAGHTGALQANTASAHVGVAAGMSTLSLEPVYAGFDDLPNELQLKILFKLPARQIQRCRKIDRHFWKLIDNNLNTCARTGTLSSLTRINNFVNTHINYPTKILNGESAFMKALTAFITLRGLSKPSPCFEWFGLCAQFHGNWERRLRLENGQAEYVLTPEEALENAMAAVDPLHSAILQLTYLHCHYHVEGCEMEDATRQREAWLAIAPDLVGLESLPQMEAVLRDIENGIWKAAHVFPECPLTSCPVDAPPSPYGIYARKSWEDWADDGDLPRPDIVYSDDEAEIAQAKLKEEQERGVADQNDSWTVVGPSRRNKNKKNHKNKKSKKAKKAKKAEKSEDEHREALPEDFMDRPFFCQDFGIHYDHKDPETLDEKFQRMFGVPDLSPQEMPFRYFVQSEWAYKLVKKLLRGKTDMTLLKKAAVLEEVYAY